MSSVHYEIFAKRPGGVMNLELTHAQEDHALRVAEQMLADGEFVGVRVVRETRDPETGEFKSAVLLKRGDQDDGKARPAGEDTGPVCREPADLYTPAARIQIARLLEGWLAKVQATPFELVHRLDLVERLQTTGGELQHAIQKIAVPQSLGRGLGVHQVVRALQQLTDQAVGRLRADRQAGVFAAVTPETFAEACRDLVGQADAAYRLAGGVADHIGVDAGWSAKTDRLLDLADAAARLDGPARALALQLLAQPLSETLASKAAMAELLGDDLDLGGQIAAFLRLIAGSALGGLAAVDPAAAALIPPLRPTAERVASRLATPGFEDIRRGLARRLVQDLAASRRLRPADPAGEVALARALGAALGAVDPQVLPAEDARAALVERSRLLVSQDFIDALLRVERPVLREVADLVQLMDGLAGGANRTQAARWILASLTSGRFEAEIASGADTPAGRMGQLARLHRHLARSRNDVGGIEAILDRIVQVADRLESERNLVRQIARAQAPVSHKLGALLRMAAGETAPPGLAAGRARAEARRLLGEPQAMAELAQDPAALKQLQGLMRAL